MEIKLIRTELEGSSKDEIVKTTLNFSNMTIPSLNLVFCPKWSLKIAFLMIWQRKKEVYNFKKSWISVNRQYKFSKVVPEVSSFPGPPVCPVDALIIVYKIN